jgi:hypothetical protein
MPSRTATSANSRTRRAGIDRSPHEGILMLVHQLCALVEMTLLLELGFTCDDVDAIFSRPNRR